MTYKNIFFDFDGVIVNSKEGKEDTFVEIFNIENVKVIESIRLYHNNSGMNRREKIINILDKFIRNIQDYDVDLLVNKFSRIIVNKIREWGSVNDLFRLSGATIGIIGMGRIGTAVAVRSKSFGLSICFYDPYLPVGIDKVFGYERYNNLYEMIKICDYVSFHAPLTTETQYIANDNFFSVIKPGSIILNTARGKIIKLDSLYRALRSDKVKAAGLDVLENEPPDFKHPLISAWMNKETWIKNRLIISPHAAFYNNESFIEMRTKAAIEAKRVIEGTPPQLQNNIANFAKT